MKSKFRRKLQFQKAILIDHNSLIHRHFERPERITRIKEAFNEYSLTERMQKLASREATTEELCLTHTWSHVNAIRKTSNKNKDLQELGEKFNSIYFHEATFKCATLAVGSVLEVVDKVLNEEYQKGICKCLDL